MHEWVRNHPEFVALLMAAWAAWVALEIFDVGQEIGSARAVKDELDRLRSEALGG